MTFAIATTSIGEIRKNKDNEHWGIYFPPVEIKRRPT